MRVDLRGRERGVAEQLLDETEVRSPVEQVRRCAVPQTVRADVRCVGDMAQQVVAHGADLETAVRDGKRFIERSVAASYPLGRGIGPVSPFWRLDG